MKRILLGLSSAILLASVMFSAPSAQAGQSYGMGYYCNKSGTSVTCHGSLRGARLSTTSTDFAEFIYQSSGTLLFATQYSGAYYVCSFPATESSRLGPAAIAGDYNMYFYVTFSTTSSTCTAASLYNDSRYQSLAKP